MRIHREFTVCVFTASIALAACARPVAAPPVAPASATVASAAGDWTPPPGQPQAAMEERDKAPPPATSEAVRPAAPPPADEKCPLSEVERQALRDALDAEHRAWSTYKRVVRDLGPERPFVNTVDAEARHIALLRELFARYQLTPPANAWAGRVPGFRRLRDACEAAAEAEEASSALYDRLLERATSPDILSTFRYLRQAEHDYHLRAFQRCASRD
jgi:rubrerythrin